MYRAIFIRACRRWGVGLLHKARMMAAEFKTIVRIDSAT
jgi:hypothetical protein